VSDPTGPPPLDVEVVVPDAHSAGVYANGFSCWYNRTDFTIDFVVHLPTEDSVDPRGLPVVRQPMQVVARVKFPPSMIFRLMQTLNDSMSNYEQQFGPIAHLGDRHPGH